MLSSTLATLPPSRSGSITSMTVAVVLITAVTQSMIPTINPMLLKISAFLALRIASSKLPLNQAGLTYR